MGKEEDNGMFAAHSKPNDLLYPKVPIAIKALQKTLLANGGVEASCLPCLSPTDPLSRYSMVWVYSNKTPYSIYSRGTMN